MSNHSEALPRFAKPPVIETVLGVYFRPLEKFTVAHQGLLWDRYFREKFPNLEERPPVHEFCERFGEERSAPLVVQWQVSDRPPTPRLWAAAENGQYVIQIQKNGLFSNWLKTGGETVYCSFAKRREEFSGQLDHVVRFFYDEGIGQFEPTSWSVTYVNHIDYEAIANVGSAAAKILTVWTDQYSDDWLPAVDKLVLDFAFPMPDNAGRLNVNLKPVVMLSTKQSVLRLDLTARGQLKKNDVESALAGIDLGHEWIVRGFTSLTHSEMHQEWERTQ